MEPDCVKWYEERMAKTSIHLCMAALICTTLTNCATMYMVGGDFRARVIDADSGKPVPGARIEVYDYNLVYPKNEEPAQFFETTANANGIVDDEYVFGWCRQYDFNVLRSSKVRITVDALGFERKSWLYNLNQIEPTESGADVMDLGRIELYATR